jgi:hypothetical protein
MRLLGKLVMLGTINWCELCKDAKLANDLPSFGDEVAIELGVLKCYSEVAEEWGDDAKRFLRDSPCELHLRQVFPGQSLISIGLVSRDLLMLCAKEDIMNP